MRSQITARLLATLILFSTSLAASEPFQTSPGQYVGGGLVGTVVGLGLGHAIQGRWTNDGWVFTLLEVLSGGAIGAGAGWWVYTNKTIEAAADKGNVDTKSQLMSYIGPVALTGVGTLLFFSFKVWEIVDVWAGASPVSNNKPAINLETSAYLKPKSFWGEPNFAISPNGVSFAVSFF